MIVSFLEPGQLESLVDAFHELGRHYFGAQASPRSAVHRHVVQDMLGAESGVRIVTAADGAKVAGLATVSLLYPAPGERAQLFMKDLYVRQTCRGRGVGEHIMRFLARYAVSKNCVRFDWTTERGNPAAMAFYERLGARRVDEKVYYRLTGAQIDELAG